MYSSLSGFETRSRSCSCRSLNASEMYLRKIRPRTTCLYSAGSMLLRSRSAAAHSLSSKPSELLPDLADLAFGVDPADLADFAGRVCWADVATAGAGAVPRIRAVMAAFSLPESSSSCARQMSLSSLRLSSPRTAAKLAFFERAITSTRSALGRLVATSRSKPWTSWASRFFVSTSRALRFLGLGMVGGGHATPQGVRAARAGISLIRPWTGASARRLSGLLLELAPAQRVLGMVGELDRAADDLVPVKLELGEAARGAYRRATVAARSPAPCSPAEHRQADRSWPRPQIWGSAAKEPDRRALIWRAR